LTNPITGHNPPFTFKVEGSKYKAKFYLHHGASNVDLTDVEYVAASSIDHLVMKYFNFRTPIWLVEFWD